MKDSHLFDDLQKGFDRYIRENWVGQLATRNRRLSAETREAHLWVPVTRAASELHWRGERVRAAVESGLLEGRLRHRVSGRATGVVHRTSLDRLKVDAASWVTLTIACKLLGRGKKAVKGMIASRQLVPVAGPTIDGSAVWQFRLEDLRRQSEPLTPETRAAAEAM